MSFTFCPFLFPILLGEKRRGEKVAVYCLVAECQVKSHHMDTAMPGYGCTVHRAEIQGVSGHQQGDFRGSHHSDESFQKGQDISILSPPRVVITAQWVVMVHWDGGSGMDFRWNSGWCGSNSPLLSIYLWWGQNLHLGRSWAGPPLRSVKDHCGGQDSELVGKAGVQEGWCHVQRVVVICCLQRGWTCSVLAGHVMLSGLNTPAATPGVSESFHLPLQICDSYVVLICMQRFPSQDIYGKIYLLLTVPGWVWTSYTHVSHIYALLHVVLHFVWILCLILLYNKCTYKCQLPLVPLPPYS